MLDWLADTILGRSRQRCIDEIRARSPLCIVGLWYGGRPRFWLQQIGSADRAPRWQACLCSVEDDGLHLYPSTRKWDQHVFFERAALRWFGRPVRYEPGINEIWLHFEQGGHWTLFMLRAHMPDMQQFVRAVKAIATEAQTTAYRRQRPYIHLGPVPVQHAEEDLYGVWTLAPEPHSLYLMPTYLVELQEKRVLRTLPLETIQQIEVMQRLDDPGADGIVRFRHNGDKQTALIAYSTRSHVAFAEALITAAKRSLEDPPVFYGKKVEDLD